jgi:hypothetical protein
MPGQSTKNSDFVECSCGLKVKQGDMRTHVESERHKVAQKKKNRLDFERRQEKREATLKPLTGYALMKWEERHLH